MNWGVYTKIADVTLVRARNVCFTLVKLQNNLSTGGTQLGIKKEMLPIYQFSRTYV